MSLTSASHNSNDQAVIIALEQLIPTLVIYIGEQYDTQLLSAGITSRLAKYVNADVLHQVHIDAASLPMVTIPSYRDWFSRANPHRYVRQGVAQVDLWSSYNVNTSEIRVLVVVLDDQIATTELQALHTNITQVYTNNGLSKVTTTLIWRHEHATAAQGLSFEPIIFVDTNRIADAVSVIEHCVVSWFGSSLHSAVQRRIHDIKQSQPKKKLQAIWMGAASIYVDREYIMRVFRERIELMFMRGWLSVLPDASTLDKLRADVKERTTSYHQVMNDSLIQILSKQGWDFSSHQQAYTFSQTQGDIASRSGFLRSESVVARKIFGGAVDKWLGVIVKPASLNSILADIRMTQSATQLPNSLDIAHAIKDHLHDCHTRVHAELAKSNEQMYMSLQVFFNAQLLNYQNSSDSSFGMKRLLKALEYFIDEIRRDQPFSLFNHLTNKTVNISPAVMQSDDFYDTVAQRLANEMYVRQQKSQRLWTHILSPLGIFVRLLIAYPLLLFLLLAVNIFVFNPATIALTVAVCLVIVGMVMYFVTVRDYYVQVARDRDDYFATYMSPQIVSIVSQITVSYREEILQRLQRLYDIYREFDLVVQHNTVEQQTSIANQNPHTRYVIRNLTRIFGDRNTLVQTSMGDAWDVLIGEVIPVYEQWQMLRLSWIGQVKARMNTAYGQRAEIVILQEIATKLFEQRRQTTTALAYLRQKIDAEIPAVESVAPISLVELVDIAQNLEDGYKWEWLAQQARVDEVRRDVTGLIVEKLECLVLSTDAQIALEGATGRNNPNFRTIDSIILSVLSDEMTRIEFEFDIK